MNSFTVSLNLLISTADFLLLHFGRQMDRFTGNHKSAFPKMLNCLLMFVQWVKPSF